MDNEHTLLERVRQLDERALSELYDLYSGEIYRYAVRLLGNADWAEDCVAETFSRLLIALNGGGGPKQYLRAYLYRIAHNWITDYYRRQPQDPISLDPEIYAEPDIEPSEVVIQEHERQQVRSALKKLTPDQRQVIALKFLEGWKNQEIARAMNKPIGAVKSLQHRGLKALRKILDNEP
jgi:RNA polymerase sigma-70 factor (ECF subfamily)